MQGGTAVGVRQVQFSDISGKEASDDDKLGQLIVIPSDGRRGYYTVDALDSELDQFVKKGERHVGKPADYFTGNGKAS